MHQNPSSFWSHFKTSVLKEQSQKSYLQPWLDSIISARVQKRGDSYYCTLQTPTELHKKRFQDFFLKDLNSYLSFRLNKPCAVEFEIIPQLPQKTQESCFSEPSSVQKPSKNSVFCEDYIFENFIVGSSNEFAYSASLAITKGALECNPLFIYGPSGLGKTHLLNAIAQKVLAENAEAKILYLSAERFLNECVMSIQKREMEKFRKKYRSRYDFLLVDDIQMIAKGEKVQEEFFHTFNELYANGTRIVFCCDQNPSSIVSLENRMRTRFEGGLIVDISYPDLETRLAIVKQKSQKKKIFLSQETLLQIATKCQNSIREIEGVLNKIKMMSELYKGGLSSSQVQKILEEVSPRELKIEDIQQKVCQRFSLTLEEMKSPTRKKNIVLARQTAMYLIRKYFRKSLTDIGLIFNKKDHTTVLNSIKKVEKEKLKNKDFKLLLEEINRDIHRYKIQN